MALYGVEVRSLAWVEEMKKVRFCVEGVREDLFGVKEVRRNI